MLLPSERSTPGSSPSDISYVDVVFVVAVDPDQGGVAEGDVVVIAGVVVGGVGAAGEEQGVVLAGAVGHLRMQGPVALAQLAVVVQVRLPVAGIGLVDRAVGEFDHLTVAPGRRGDVPGVDRAVDGMEGAAGGVLPLGPGVLVEEDQPALFVGQLDLVVPEGDAAAGELLRQDEDAVVEDVAVEEFVDNAKGGVDGGLGHLDLLVADGGVACRHTDTDQQGDDYQGGFSHFEPHYSCFVARRSEFKVSL
ncbi:MAG: hypothetical protein GF399_05265 [Candidatus Coatesbacteria bacterium]|nr:hypothetical protein [Candidatus Coatesbacteria bacterium]